MNIHINLNHSVLIEQLLIALEGKEDGFEYALPYCQLRAEAEEYLGKAQPRAHSFESLEEWVKDSKYFDHRDAYMVKELKEVFLTPFQKKVNEHQGTPFPIGRVEPVREWLTKIKDIISTHGYDFLKFNK